jgi:hypothetical protein
LIQRSLDGVSFEDVGSVNAKGTTVQISTYQFLDSFYLPVTIYYRLKQIDINGHFSYSGIRTVLPNNIQSSLNIYPNPVIGTNMHIDLGDKVYNTLNVFMYSSAGIVYAGGTYSNCKNILDITLPNSLKSGYYKMVCYDNNDNKIADSGVIVE